MYDDHLFRVSLKCFVTNTRDEVLVVKESGRSSYDLPGGGMEHGENIRAAIARELREEIDYGGNFTYEIITADDPAKLSTRDVWQLKLIFRVVLESNDISKGADADEAMFINPIIFKHSLNISEKKIYEYAKVYL